MKEKKKLLFSKKLCSIRNEQQKNPLKSVTNIVFSDQLIDMTNEKKKKKNNYENEKLLCFFFFLSSKLQIKLFMAHLLHRPLHLCVNPFQAKEEEKSNTI